MKFKVGDRVTFPDWNSDKQLFGRVFSLDSGWGEGSIAITVDGYDYLHTVSPYHVVKTTSVELEAVYNSPLYKALA